MSDVLSGMIAGVALLLSVMAIVLATVANRRWVRRPRPDVSDPPAVADLRPELDALAEGLSEVRFWSQQMSRDLDDVGAGGRATLQRVTALESGAGGTAARVDALESDVRGWAGQFEGLAQQGADLAQQGADLGQQGADLAARVDAANLGIQGAGEGIIALSALVDTLVADVGDLRRAPTPPDPTALRHVAVIRYDAFSDVGGRLSYSVALLDDTRSGLVLTTLAGKSDVRTYVRTVSAGRGDGNLSAEEQQAIDVAGGQA